MTGRRPHPRARLTRALLVVGIGALVLGVLGRPSWAQDGSDAALDPPDGLSLVTQTAWVAPSGQFVVRLRTAGLAAGTVVDAAVHTSADGRIRFDRSIRAEDLGPTLSPGPAPTTLGITPALSDGSIQITIPVSRTGPAPDGGVVLTRPGVYPVVITATAPDGAVQDQLVTHLIRLPTDDTTGPSLAVGTVVTLDASVIPGEGGAPTITASASEQAIAVMNALTRWPSVALTVDPTPALLAALDQSPSGRDAVAELSADLTGRQILAAPYVVVDTGAWVAADLIAELDGQLAAGAATASALLGTAPDGRTAMADPTITPEALTRLNDLGLDRLVVPADQLGELPAGERNVTFTELFDVTDSTGETIQAVTADQELAGRLDATDDPVLNGHLALADLAVLYNDEPGVSRGVALALDRGVDPATLAVLLDGLTERAPADGDGRAIVSPVTLDDLFRTTTTATTTSDGRTTNLIRPYLSAPPSPLGAYPTQLRATSREVEGFRSLTEPSPGAALTLDQSLLLSGGRELPPDERTAILDDVSVQIESVTSEIVAPLQQFVTLTSQSGKIPLNLENRSPFPVRVHVVLDSDKLEFPDGDVVDTVLPAAATTRLDVQVTTRASGAFPLTVAVRSPDDILDITDTQFTVRSTAISGVGLVLSIGAGAFLLIWWARHFRKTRRARALVDSSHPVLTDPPGAP